MHTPHDARPVDDSIPLATLPVRALLRRPPVTVPPDLPIQATARIMREHRISSVLLARDDGALVGLVTDRDLRNRVLAEGLDPARPVSEIATTALQTVDIGDHAFDALLLMARLNIHHVPVMDGQTVVGVISSTDLQQQQSNSAVNLAGAIYRQESVEELVATASRIGQLQRQLAAASTSAHATGRIVSAMTDALTSRLLQLAEAQYGPPPVPYAWVAAGSQGRNEQTAKSDQDNCLILDDGYDPAAHGPYFEALARFVCDGLNACGYIYCPGEMMAMTDTWRQPLARWREYFRAWIERPEPKALMLTCVFFDQRFVHGERALLDTLRAEVLQRTPGQRIFLAHMVSNALTHQPPLGWLGGIHTIRRGEHEGTVDLKHSGIVPIVDLARIYALAGGIAAVSTRERLQAAASSGEISAERTRDLIDALDFLGGLRIQHQARLMADGQAADNYLRLDELSELERRHLKDAFGVVKDLQSVLEKRYLAGRF
ncbi:MAG: putative nucleotidyltransferase substrate binding domain-containing protein [Tepidimonas sp.]|uniref:putative nucleotidyltransferase substrate binding domain-containing protein n=1 Tax=Tepidimonas sp. TaxID=2002775 RepID=UPI00259EDB0A|nr:putative nucleotidyltransferase substrate binding domain-containing protein [Tepidimonas sp.]MDM7456150.1 putative nucleotidyltransferase substrate binding domain-containing protein [Tepidimonas sp.]